MRGVHRTIIVMAVLFAVAIFYGDLTGAAFRVDSTGRLLGQHLNYHPEREFTSVEILGEEINEAGLPVIERGSAMLFVVKPGMNGVHTGYQTENAISGLRFDGDHCGRGGNGDFCSNTYKCADEDLNRCNIVSSKCYGDKLVDVRIPEDQTPGNYVISVCDAIDECCEYEIREEFVVV